MKSGNSHVHPVFQGVLDAVGPKPGNPDAKTTIDLLELSNLHALVNKAYRYASEIQDSARAAHHSASQLRTELYLALSNLEDRIEVVEGRIDVHVTRYVTRSGYRCPECGKHEVADAETPCSSCGVMMVRAG